MGLILNIDSSTSLDRLIMHFQFELVRNFTSLFCEVALNYL